MSVPPCDGSCGRMLRDKITEMGLDAHVTHVPPIVESPYEDLNLRCPHGVLWHAAPTGEQIAQWVKDCVP